MFKKFLILLLVLLFFGCSQQDEYCSGFLSECVGKKVKLEGEISKIIWQHMTVFEEEYPYTEYVDVEDENQIVVYSKDKIDCSGEFLFEGEVIMVEGPGKGSKDDETYAEYHVLIDEWECLK